MKNGSSIYKNCSNNIIEQFWVVKKYSFTVNTNGHIKKRVSIKTIVQPDYISN